MACNTKITGSFFVCFTYRTPTTEEVIIIEIINLKSLSGKLTSNDKEFTPDTKQTL